MFETLLSSSQELSKKQLHRFVLALKNYLELKVPARSKNRGEQEHLKRRKAFVATTQKEDWVAKLKDKVSSMGWKSL